MPFLYAFRSFVALNVFLSYDKNMNQPKNLSLALPTKRFVSFAIDFALAAIIGYVLFAFWGSKGLFTSLGGEALWQEAMEFYGTSHLYNIDKNEDGSWAKTYEILDYDVVPSNAQAKPGFEYYLGAVYLFYTDYLPNSPHIDSVNGVAAKDYYTGAYFCSEIMGLPSDLSSINIEDPATYTSKNGYFEYGLNTDGSAVDVEAKPVVSRNYQSLINANDTATLTKYFKLFVDGTTSNTASGIFYDAAVLLSKQSYLVPIARAYSKVNWVTNVVSFSIPLVAFFLLVPFAAPNGETLGELITRIGIAQKNGVRIKWWQRFLRPWVLAICLCPFVFVPRNYQMFALMGAIILLFIDFAFALRDKTGNYRTLADRMCGTLVYDKKKSKLLHSDKEVEQYDIDHNVMETVNNEIIKVVDSEAILNERSLIDLDSLDNRDMNGSSFDEFENGKEDK